MTRRAGAPRAAGSDPGRVRQQGDLGEDPERAGGEGFGLTANVGGSCGMKNLDCPEYTCILHAAKALGRPVKWTDERSTSFLSDSQGRAQLIHAELALDAGESFLPCGFPATAISAPTSPVSRRGLCRSTPARNLASVYRTNKKRFPGLLLNSAFLVLITSTTIDAEITDSINHAVLNCSVEECNMNKSTPK